MCDQCKFSILNPQEGYVGALSVMGVITEEPSGEDTASNDGSEHNPAEVLDSTDNIKLQRVTGVSMRHTKALPASVLKEGWMVHYTNKSNLVMIVSILFLFGAVSSLSAFIIFSHPSCPSSSYTVSLCSCSSSSSL